MDLGVIITGLIIVSICSIPFIIIGVHRKKKQKQAVQTFLALTKEHGCNPSVYEFWNNSAIGIDKISGTAILCRTQNDIKSIRLMNLLEVNSCEAIITRQESQVISKIEIVFSCSKKDKTSVRWEMYNSDYDSLTISNELQVIEKWVEILSQDIVGR